VERHDVWEEDDESRSRGRERGRAVGTREVGCGRPTEMPWIGSCGPVEVGSQTMTNLARAEAAAGGIVTWKTQGFELPKRALSGYQKYSYLSCLPVIYMEEQLCERG
jgi:hypothetical protein